MAELSDLAALWDALERHDWYHAWSDDNSVHRHGLEQRDSIERMARDIGPDAFDLVAEFSAHKFSGAAFGNEKLPKPSRPTTVSTFPGTPPTVHPEQLELSPA